MKLWDKGYSVNEKIDHFTVGKDRELDLLLAPYDILGTMAHIRMLAQVGMLSHDDLSILIPKLQELYADATSGRFVIEEDIEDVHSQVELILTRSLGDMGKKVHTGRSRNDQILVDLKLYTRAEIEKTVSKVQLLFSALQQRSEACRDILMPGYTHLQVAMPSSFGQWFGAYAESLTDDMRLMHAAFDIVNLNPLGSAAGYGSSAPLDRHSTTQLLGFADLNYNAVYAQMTRGKTEYVVSFAYASLAATLARLATDCCLFNSQNFGFITLPDELTTGSSIMPQKHNPDVFELIRAHCNHLAAIPDTIRHITTNLPVGYFRDMQLLKEVYLPLFSEMDDCLDITLFAIENMRVTPELMSNPLYQTAFSVEEVNRLVTEGVPFRDAYRRVADDINSGTFHYQGTLHHTHEGSIGNLCNTEIKQKMQSIVDTFPFDAIHLAIENLVRS